MPCACVCLWVCVRCMPLSGIHKLSPVIWYKCLHLLQVSSNSEIVCYVPSRTWTTRDVLHWTPFGSLLQLCDVQLCINTIRLILSVLWRRSLYASQIVWFIYLSRGWHGVSINIFKIFSPKFIHWVKWKKLCTDSRLVNIQIFTITNRRVWPNLWGSQDHPLHAFNPAAWRRFKYLPFMVSAVMSLRFKHPRF